MLVRELAVRVELVPRVSVRQIQRLHVKLENDRHSPSQLCELRGERGVFRQPAPTSLRSLHSYLLCASEDSPTPLEELHGTLVLLGGCACAKRSEIAPLTSLWVLLPGVQ